MLELLLISTHGSLIALILAILRLRFQHQPLNYQRLLFFMLMMLPISYGCWLGVISGDRG